MRKDIEIPTVKDVEIAAVFEWNEEYMQNSWYAYLFNNTDKDMEAILIVSQASGTLDGEERKTGSFRHAFPKLSPKSSQKIELLDEAVFQLDNQFFLTYFTDAKLFDKKYLFAASSISEDKLSELKNSDKKGILAI